tara:strand:- start:1081 stop:1518 length:438 start_codon:yes stop_codon:yes gene_type:complete
MSLYISIDPGNKKCGLLIADMQSRSVMEAGISSLNYINDLISIWNKNYLIKKIIIGNGTNCNYIVKKLNQKNLTNYTLVNERGSTFRARFRYWDIWPPHYFISWIPKELLFPPKNLDAIVALILLEDFLNSKLIWPQKVNIKTWP